ncbi:MAG: nucleoside 2-deoxyribosyltransferase [Steroidobacteraceae bacterium]|jgi:nucleoside 2-deoxyribosyltransferase
MKPAALYFAAPLFTPWERILNERLVSKLEAVYTVFLPQRDGLLLPGSDLSSYEFQLSSRRVFEMDVNAIKASSVIFAVLDGRTVDEGVALELGLAWALGKRCVGYRTDSRVLLEHGINPMIANACELIVASEEQLSQWLALEAGKSH